MKSALLILCVTATLIMSGCDRLSDRVVEQTAQLTGGGNARAGRTEIRKYGCNACHEISGVPGARGLIGPPLNGIGSRYFIAGQLTNTPSNLMQWIQHPHSVEAHTAMPEMEVTPEDSRDIAAYLYTLK